MIQVQQLSFRYPGADGDALREVSLEIPHGSLFGLLGPNGAGKTTLLSILCGLLPYRDGKIQVDGTELREGLHRVRGMSALIPQDLAFYYRLTTRQNLEFFAGLHGLRGARRNGRVEEVVRLAQLQNHLDKRAGALSGGLRRRLNIAIGLLNEPGLLFMDEPTVGIDPQSRHFILNTIRELNQRGTTVIYTSHYLNEIEELCDCLAIIDHGAIICQGKLPEMLEQYNDGLVSFRLAADLSGSLQEALQALAGFSVANRSFTAQIRGTEELARLTRLIRESGNEIQSLNYGHQSLESLFLKLTHTALRE
jgi:ABC-2 type transport system ATP-binding protein